jgi:hypothetical protein
MLDKDSLDKIETLLSAKKISIYKEKYSSQWFEYYKLELKEAKEILVSLHFLEVFLRNRISNKFTSEYGEWIIEINYKFDLNSKEKKKIKETIQELNLRGKEVNFDNIISNLNFGFWTNLFHKSYHVSVWQKNKMLDRVFPFLRPYQRDLAKIQKELEAIRKFRNRIFHFESLYSWNLEEMKKIIDKFIYGISGIAIDEITK